VPDTLLIPALAVVASLVLLALSADKFVDGASAVAHQLGVSPLLIGLTIVSFGTSAPEILIAVMSALEDSAALAIGNAIGSNIANIALILGTASVLVPLPVAATVFRREMPLLMAVVAFTAVLLFDLNLSLADGAAMMVTLFLCLGWLVYQGRSPATDIPGDVEASDDGSTNRALLITFIALLVLLVSSKILVWGAVEIARAMEVSELMIGLSIIAIGTSLPELAATIACVMRREFDLAIGNVVGSNLFNALAVLGVVGLLAPGDFDVMVRNRDMVVQIVLTLALFVFCIAWRNKVGRINRLEGALLLLAFVGYQWLLYAQESGVATAN